MKRNIDKLASFITKYGIQNILIHKIYETSNWIVCQKIEKQKWQLTLCNPMGNTTYNLGIVNDSEHIILWKELTKIEIEKKLKLRLLTKELKLA